jgi:hypothetical protein
MADCPNRRPAAKPNPPRLIRRVRVRKPDRVIGFAVMLERVGKCREFA